MLCRCFAIHSTLYSIQWNNCLSSSTAGGQAQHWSYPRKRNSLWQTGYPLSCLIAHARPTKDNLSAALVHPTVSLMTLSDLRTQNLPFCLLTCLIISYPGLLITDYCFDEFRNKYTSYFCHCHPCSAQSQWPPELQVMSVHWWMTVLWPKPWRCQHDWAVFLWLLISFTIHK